MKVLKGIFIAGIMIMILGIFQPTQFAAESNNVKTFDQMKASINQFMTRGKNGSTGMTTSKMGDIVVPIANILTAIGVITLIGATVIMGIKYMFASPDEAAKLKQQLIGLVVAGVVVLGATAIWKLVYNVLNSSGL